MDSQWRLQTRDPDCPVSQLKLDWSVGSREIRTNEIMCHSVVPSTCIFSNARLCELSLAAGHPCLSSTAAVAGRAKLNRILYHPRGVHAFGII
jgi:hypothetical protein